MQTQPSRVRVTWLGMHAASPPSSHACGTPSSCVVLCPFHQNSGVNNLRHVTHLSYLSIRRFPAGMPLCIVAAAARVTARAMPLAYAADVAAGNAIAKISSYAIGAPLLGSAVGSSRCLRAEHALGSGERALHTYENMSQYTSCAMRMPRGACSSGTFADGFPRHSSILPLPYLFPPPPNEHDAQKTSELH